MGLLSELFFSCSAPRKHDPADIGGIQNGGLAEVPIGGKLNEAAVSVFRERSAMILGMNPQSLREKRSWSVYLWRMRHHWALVLQPAGELFTARVVDDFVRNPQHCFNIEVLSKQFFLVYELLVEEGDLFLMLSVKCNFDPDYDLVEWLGEIGPMNFEELEMHALAVIKQYRSYCFIGCNCQHFVTDLALSVGVPFRVTPEDEAMVCAASDSAAALGTVGVSVATAAASGALGIAAFASFAPSAAAIASLPCALYTVAAVAGTVGVLGGVTLIGVTISYRTLYDALRDTDDPRSHAANRSMCSGNIVFNVIPSAKLGPQFAGFADKPFWICRQKDL